MNEPCTASFEEPGPPVSPFETVLIAESGNFISVAQNMCNVQNMICKVEAMILLYVLLQAEKGRTTTKASSSQLVSPPALSMIPNLAASPSFRGSGNHLVQDGKSIRLKFSLPDLKRASNERSTRFEDILYI